MSGANPGENPGDEFFEQILGLPNFPGDPSVEAGGGGGTGSGGGMAPPPPPMMLQLGSGDAFGMGVGGGGGYHTGTVFPLGLSLELEGRGGGGGGSGGGYLKVEDGGSGSAAATAAVAKRFHDDVVVDGRGSVVKNVFHGQPVPATIPVAPHPPAIRPRVRARRGQATDPHSIAERLRRERIAERIRQLQDLVPSVNKTDRAAMLDEIVDYVKFLRLQVKVLSMSRLGGAGAVAPLVTDIPLPSVEEEGGEGGRNQPAWEKWSNDGTERQVAKLMEENVGAAMQFLQSKALCIMPISLATAIYQSQPPDTSSLVKSESNPPS
ncbi:hypothetical protein MLD38_025056 [Melastoma candidum]|uniref:Uncharacterized protein n=1 Tax=Melastoma candidum TaxID=119954 RepID=A0ACB9NXN3_9MYRT|nr:hypothetical protein MLD38_025056 [Melastoma candidum]